MKRIGSACVIGVLLWSAAGGPAASHGTVGRTKAPAAPYVTIGPTTVPVESHVIERRDQVPAEWQATDQPGQVPAEAIEAFFLGGPDREPPGTPTPADRRFAALAAAAERTIDVAAYTLDRDSVLDGLLAAHEPPRVTVRVVVDVDPDAGGNPPWLRLENAGIEFVTDDRSSLHHNKFAVFDGAVTWTGSANFTDKGFSANSENVVVITSTAVAKAFTTQFEEMHVQRLFSKNNPPNHLAPIDVGGISVELAFGPGDDMRAQISRAIESADKSLFVAMNIFTDDQLADDLIAEQKSGVEVVVLLDEGWANREYSVAPQLRASGVTVLVEDFTGVLHDKSAVIDAGTLSDPIVITGSPNWSKNGMESNDENSVVIHSHVLALQYCRRFGHLAETAPTEFDMGGRCDSIRLLPLAVR